MVDRALKILPFLVLAIVLVRIYQLRQENRALGEEVIALRSEKRVADDQMYFWREVGQSLMRNAQNPLVFEEPTLVYAFDPNCPDCWKGLSLLENYDCTNVEVVATSVSGGHDIPEYVTTDISSEDWRRLPLVPSSAVLYKDGRIQVWPVLTQSMNELQTVACE